MAHLSELVRPGSGGTKKELLACARGLAEVSERITELSKELARHCTDKKIRTNLLQVCEKIPTLGTQLRVLSTVKATMMTNEMNEEEDYDATDMLVSFFLKKLSTFSIPRYSCNKKVSLFSPQSKLNSPQSLKKKMCVTISPSIFTVPKDQFPCNKIHIFHDRKQPSKSRFRLPGVQRPEAKRGGSGDCGSG